MMFFDNIKIPKVMHRKQDIDLYSIVDAKSVVLWYNVITEVILC